MAEIPGYVFPRKLDAPLPLAVKAEGVWIEDAQGKRYLDASGGAVVVNLGHGRVEIAEAVRDQLLRCYYAHPTMFTTPVVEELAAALARHAPAGIGRFYFVSSGSEAVETAVKLARQIHLDLGRPHKFRLIARWKAYHGLTLGALAATTRLPFRTPFGPMFQDAFHIPAPYCLRCSFGLTFPDCRLRCALALEEAIQNLGPDTVSAFLGETVSGASLAAWVPPAGYWPKIREICDRYQVLLIQDEVLCGLGRTGRWFASEHFDVVPDIVTMGKGISGGAIPLSGVGVKNEYFEAIRQGGGSFAHGGTFSHHPVAGAAGLAAVSILERENLVERAWKVGLYLGKRLEEALGDSPYLGHAHGLGCLWGIELVQDRKTLQPFPRREKVTERIWDKLFERGIIVYKSVGLAGLDGDGLLIAPPFVIEEKDVDYVVQVMAEAIKEVLG